MGNLRYNSYKHSYFSNDRYERFNVSC